MGDFVPRVVAASGVVTTERQCYWPLVGGGWGAADIPVWVGWPHDREWPVCRGYCRQRPPEGPGSRRCAPDPEAAEAEPAFQRPATRTNPRCWNALRKAHSRALHWPLEKWLSSPPAGRTRAEPLAWPHASCPPCRLLPTSPWAPSLSLFLLCGAPSQASVPRRPPASRMPDCVCGHPPTQGAWQGSDPTMGPIRLVRVPSEPPLAEPPPGTRLGGAPAHSGEHSWGYRGSHGRVGAAPPLQKEGTRPPAAPPRLSRLERIMAWLAFHQQGEEPGDST